MNGNLVFLIIVGFFMLVGISILFTLALTVDKKVKAKTLRTSLSNFGHAKIENALFKYKDELEEHGGYNNIVAKYENECNNIAYLKITKAISSFENRSPIYNLKHIFRTRHEFKELVEMVERYEQYHLDLRFHIFDLTSDIEIEKAVFKKLRDQSSHVNETIQNSPIPRIRDSKKLDKKIKELRVMLFNLEKMINDERIHLSQKFIDGEEEIVRKISSIVIDVDFMNHNIKHLDEDLAFATIGIVETYKENKAILSELDELINDYVRKIKALKKSINEKIDDLKTKEAVTEMGVLDKLINELHLIIYSNVDYAKFNYDHDNVVSLLLEYVKNNHVLFVSEIKRHRLEDEQTRLMFLEDYKDSFDDAVTKYEREKISQIDKLPPADVNRLFVGVLDAYIAYINVAKDKVKDISKVNESTNEINMLIAKMNTSLLQVEHNIVTIKGRLRNEFEYKKSELQSDVMNLRNRFINNTEAINEEEREIVNKIKNKVDDLVDETRSKAFEIYFIREAILYINRYKGHDIKMDYLIDSLTEKFNDENYSEALRKAKEIIDIYGIK